MVETVEERDWVEEEGDEGAVPFPFEWMEWKEADIPPPLPLRLMLVVPLPLVLLLVGLLAEEEEEAVR